MSGETGKATDLVVKRVSAVNPDVIAVLSIDRPAAANAFNDTVLKELLGHLATLKASPHCRALILRGKGKHFSAGADLQWMQASAQLSYAENLADAGELRALFEALAALPMPTIAVVTGSAYGGAVGLTACCDFAIAGESARFCLSEVKLGLAPAVILPYLARKMQLGQLRRQALTGRVFSAAEALAFGLVERVVPEAEIGQAVHAELTQLLQGAPAAQTAVKALLSHVTQGSAPQSSATVETIAKLRTGPSGQAGLAAFFAKAPPPWQERLATDFRWDQ